MIIIINFLLFFVLIGTDTVKRGISSAGLNSTSSLTNGKIKESISNYSMKNDHKAGSKDGNREWYTLDRNRSGATPSARSVLFSSDALSSLSSYSLSDKVKSPNLTHSPSTSQLIKQTLSPLAQHRNISHSSLSDANHQASSSPSASNKNPINNSLSSYQFPSSSLNLKNNHLPLSSALNNDSNSNNNNHHHQSPLSIRKTTSALSPARSLSNNITTNTLPSSVARNMLYQTDSYNNTSVTSNFTSPGNGIASSSSGTAVSGNGIGNHHTLSSSGGGGGGGGIGSYNNIYGTLPKNISSPFNNSNSITGVTGNGITSPPSSALSTTAASASSASSSLLYGNSTLSSTTLLPTGGNEFDKLIAKYSGGGSSNIISSGAGNYNTIGSYKVQYSSTNPFLPTFNPNSNDSTNITNDK